MDDDVSIDVFKCLDFLRDTSKVMAQAKANRVYMEESRKSMKAIKMKEAEKSGATSAAIQEREAYASDDYVKHLEALKIAVEDEERMRWLMIAAQARIEAWRSLESTRRIEAKTV